MRATIKEVAFNRVEMTEDEYEAVWSEDNPPRHTVIYFAPLNGGYVRIDDGRRYPQVCEKLCGLGPTLYWSGKRPLIDLIRRERRRFVAESYREQRHW